MKKCILCGNETFGSVGAAGIKWAVICQPCKNAEDKALDDRLSYEAKVYDKVISAGGVKGTN